MSLLSKPFASSGKDGVITVRPGTLAYQFSGVWEWVAPVRRPPPELPRKTIGIENWPPDIYRICAALLTIWSKATSEKLQVMNSITGRNPHMAAPTPKPEKPFSLIGVSMIRLGPNRFNRPSLT